MTRDQEIVKLLQQRLPYWKMDSRCHAHNGRQCCVYNESGRIIELHLCGLKLRQLPPEVERFSALQGLGLHYNQLSSLPAEIGQLSSLQLISLSSNQLSSLPVEVCQISSLQQLDLSNNKLSSLPAEIGQLSSLRILNLYYNQLSSLPAEIGQLSSLRILDLGANQLSSLPAEIGQLSSLQRLDLYHNQLSSLPVEIGQLSSLQRLGLSTNQLSSLPVEIGQLSSLQQLWLPYNQLSSLPVEIGQLSSLQWLSLGNNQLSSLPAEISQLSSLQRLDLYHNPLQSPLSEIIPQGEDALFGFSPSNVLTYLRTLLTIKIFYCYAHEDKDLRDRIDKHLGVLKRREHVVVWYDREIQAGMEWEREIERHLSTSHIILLLVSAAFVHSDYCYGKEMRRALEMHEKGKARVIPILLSPVDWRNAPFAKLQILPTGAKPITIWLNQDEALKDVAEQISAVVTALRTQQGSLSTKKTDVGDVSEAHVNE